jgi:hypothetical protein
VTGWWWARAVGGSGLAFGRAQEVVVGWGRLLPHRIDHSRGRGQFDHVTHAEGPRVDDEWGHGWVEAFAVPRADQNMLLSSWTSLRRSRCFVLLLTDAHTADGRLLFAHEGVALPGLLGQQVLPVLREESFTTG